MSIDLGTIQYNVEADTTGIDAANAAVDVMAVHMDEAAQSTDKLGSKISETAKKSESATSAIASSFDKINSALRREIDLYGETSRAATLRYDLERGALGTLTTAQKSALTTLAETADQMDRASMASAELARAERQAAESAKLMQSALDNQFKTVESGLLREIELYGSVSRAAKLAFEIEAGSLKNLSAAQKQNLTAMSAQLDALEKGAGKAAGGLGGVRSIAQSAGYQLQDIAVQAQMGASAFTILGQQGSQFASSFGPTGAVVGAVLAVGAALGGVLFASLMKSSKAMEEAGDNAKEMARDVRDLTAAQRENLELSNRDVTNKKIKEANELTDIIKKQTDRVKELNEENGKRGFAVVGGGFGVSGQVQEITIDNTKKIREEQEKLNATTLQYNVISKEIENTRDIEGARKTIQSLRDQTDLIGLVGEALWRQKGIQEGLTKANLENYVAEGLRNDAAQKTIDDIKKKSDADKKASDDAIKAEKDRASAIKKTEELEKRRSDSIANTASQMQREIDLFGETSRAAKLEYDITHDLIKVKGGLDGIEAQLLITKAKRLDQMYDEVDLAKQLDEEGDSARENSKKLTKDAAKFSDDAIERINGAFSSAWLGLLDNSKDAFDGLKSAFKQTLAEMAHEAVTKPIILGIQQSISGGATSAAQGASSASGGTGMLGAAGIYGAAAIAVVAAVGIWNKQQDEKFVKMTAEYKQANQGMSETLGMGLQKSDTINTSIEKLGHTGGEALGVNYEMLNTLIDIRTGIGNVASGFARTLIGGSSPEKMGIKTGYANTAGGLGRPADFFNKWNTVTLGNNALTDFLNSITNGIAKAIYNKKTSVIDSGIAIIGGTLQGIMDGAILEAKNYADVKTTKKIIGINAGSDVYRATEDLDETFRKQITGVFASAGEALEIASKSFGIDFERYQKDLIIKSQDLSLQGLEGDALTKEIEAFFGSTMDNWASVLLSGTSVLLDFQNIGETAFDTMLRLSAETNVFSDYADKLSLNFKASGLAAVYATQSIADLSGGFDSLQSSLATYYDKFFSESDKFADSTKAVTEYFADLNIAVPKTREGFKALIESIDLTTEAGQKQFSSLVSISSAMDDYLSQLEKQKAALVDNSYSGLQRAVDAQKKILNAQIDISTKALSASQSVFDALHNTLNGLIDDSVTTQEATRRQAQNQLAGMLASSKGGALPNIDELNRALSTISRPSENLYSTFDEYATDFYKTADVIKQLQDAAGNQVSIEEKSLAALESQSLALDETLVWAKRQVDAINGVDVSVLTVAQALNNFSVALGIQVPQVMQDHVNASLAAASAQSTAADPAKIAAEQQAQAQTDTMNAMMKEFAEYVQSTQLAIVTNTDKSFRLIDKWDKTGMPPEREVL